ncbi:hypothetical protein C8Q80DRAFT_1183107 [Daedaleopsis nitida]|nr:hypothetical protein C8Q80DRAFT_1183107 [Daedaleopsis nitida]
MVSVVVIAVSMVVTAVSMVSVVVVADIVGTAVGTVELPTVNGVVDAVDEEEEEGSMKLVVQLLPLLHNGYSSEKANRGCRRFH